MTRVSRFKTLADALGSRLVSFVPLIADTSVGAKGIDAHSVSAQAGYGPALVDV